jgi:membrane-associated protein
MFDQLIEFIKFIQNSEEIIKVGGLTLVTLIVYAETGLFFCFFFPGDYLLFTAGLLCGTGTFDVSIYTLTAFIWFAAVAGNSTGFAFGRYVGQKLYEKEESIFFKKSHLTTTTKAFEKFGGKALIVGRFLPIVRTFAPILAGAARMKPLSFMIYNMIGATLWVFILVLAGYFLGQEYPQIVNYVEYIILAFIGVTSVAVIKSYITIRRQHRQNAKISSN